MVSVLLIFLTVLLVQAALYLYVRNIVTAAAAEGARYAADANVDPARGAERTHEVIARGTSRSVADRLPCRGAEEPPLEEPDDRRVVVEIVVDVSRA